LFSSAGKQAISQTLRVKSRLIHRSNLFRLLPSLLQVGFYFGLMIQIKGNSGIHIS